MVFLLVVIALCAVAAGVLVPKVIDHRFPAFGKEGTIRIYESTDFDSFMQQVSEKLEPRHPASLMRAMRSEGAQKHIFPGQYHFDTKNSAIYAARAVTRGWQNPVNVTITCPLRSVHLLAQRMSSQLMVSEELLEHAFRNDALLSKYGMSSVHLFEYIIPDTYQMYWTSTPEEIIKRLKKEYDAFWTDERREAAARIGLTPSQVSVLASIVAEESSKADEYPKIASVYLTRLRKGIKLQACPTVCYIYDYKIRRVLSNHLKNPSIYNTYMYEGLPPTPISLPGKEHIDAVLHPDKTPYLYFCADPALNGRNIFSVTYKEHLAHADEYHKAMDELALRKEAEQKADRDNE